MQSHPRYVHTGDFGLGYGALALSSIYQTINTIAGATYVFDFWQKQQDSSVSTEFAAYWNGTQVLDIVDKPADNLWTHYSFNVIATGATTEIKFALRQYKGGSALDDVNVVQADTIATPEPSSIALVCTALPMGLGLAWKRRRKAVTA